MSKKNISYPVLDETAVTDTVNSFVMIRAFARYARARKGDKKAVVAVAHEMLRVVWFMLKRGEPYRGEKRGLSWRKLKRLERVALGGFQA